MDVSPDVISGLGFKHAPVSRFLLVSTGIPSVAAVFLSNGYRKLFTVSWTDVIHKKQILRFICSQFIVDNSFDVICNCLFIYYFLVLERRWGSKKYISFFFTNWSLSLGLYFILFKSKILASNIPMVEIVPKGIYGPLFSMLVYYYKDIRSNAENGRFSFSKKTFVYMLAAQMVLSNEKTFLMASCGIISGMIYRLNLLKIQSWFTIPNAVSSRFQRLYSFFLSGEAATTSRKAYMGATPEIHEDMVFDYVMSRQRQNVVRGGGDRRTVGQGYADIINPSFGSLFNNARHVEQPTPPTPQAPLTPQAPPTPQPPPYPEVVNEAEPTSDVREEKVKTLVDMGFARDAVVDALASANNDIQHATSILLSAQ